MAVLVGGPSRQLPPLTPPSGTQLSALALEAPEETLEQGSDGDAEDVGAAELAVIHLHLETRELLPRRGLGPPKRAGHLPGTALLVAADEGPQLPASPPAASSPVGSA